MGTLWRAEPANFNERTLDRLNDASPDLLIACVFDVAPPAGIASVAAAEPEEDLEPFIENEDDDAADHAEELDDAA